MYITNKLSRRSKLLLLIIVLVIFEDLIRKFVPGHTPLIFLIKDFFIFILYGTFFIDVISGRKVLFNSPIFFPLLFLFVYELISLTWTKDFYLLVFLSGLKIDFYYVFLVFITPYLIIDHKLLNKLNKLIKITLIFLLFLQLFEIIFPSISNKLTIYSISDDFDKVFHLGHSFTAGNFISYHKTYFFSSGKFSDMVFHLYLLFLVTSLLLKKVASKTLILYTVIIFFMLFMSGKRIFIILVPLLLFGLVFSLYKYNNQVKKYSIELYLALSRLKKVFAYSIIISIGGVVYLYFTNETVGLLIDFVYSALTDGLIARYFENGSSYNFEFFRLIKEDYLWYGQGVGTNTQGVTTFLPDAEFLLNSYEMGFFKFINEHGLLGLILFISLIISSFKFDLNAIKFNYLINYKIISILILIYHIIFFLRFLNGHQFFGSTQTIFWFWIIMGVQLFLYRKGKYGKKENISF
jgi:hypothetical protein